MSTTQDTKKASAPDTSRTRRPFITTKRTAPTRRAVHDTKERQDALQKQYTKEHEGDAAKAK